MGENKREGGQKGVLVVVNIRANPILGLAATEESKMQLINVAMQVRPLPSTSLFHS